MRRFTLTLITLVTIGGSMACSRASTASVDASFAGKNAKLVYGIARTLSGAGVYVVLSSRAIDCKLPSQVTGDQRVEFWIPEGPRGSFFVGKVGLDVALSSGAAGESPTIASRRATTVDLEPSAGDRIRGSLKIHWSSSDPANAGVYDASGSFDVKLCEKTSALSPPKIAGDHPARGAFAGVPFEVKGAVAWVDRERGSRYVSRIQLFPTADVTCGGADLRALREMVVMVNAIGGTAEGATHLGSAEPAAAVVDRWVGNRLQSASLGRTAIRFETLELARGGTIAGAVLATSAGDAPPGELEGSFSARVCEPLDSPP